MYFLNGNVVLQCLTVAMLCVISLQSSLCINSACLAATEDTFNTTGYREGTT